MPSAPESRVPVFLSALRTSLGRPPLWVVCCLFSVLPALVVAQPWFQWYEGQIHRAYEPGSLVGNLDQNFRTDHAAEMNRLNEATGSLAAVLAGFAMLAGAFCAGGWLQVFLERTEGHSVRRFFYGGSRYFWRFFRVLLITLLLLHFAGWLLFGTPWTWLVEKVLLGVTDGDLEVLGSERAALWVHWTQDALYALLLGLVLAWGFYTRTRLALHGTKSAVWAGICSLFTILRHPVRTLVPLLALALAELAVLVPLGAFASGVERNFEADSSASRVWALVALGLVGLAWRAVIWGAQYSAVIRVSRDVVPPLALPDPWQNRVGGPGGPQYPLGGDEYGVSL